MWLCRSGLIKMKFIFITLFPEFIADACNFSIIKRGREAGLFTVQSINPRDFTTDNHRTVDDTPCGGGAGMVLKVEPFFAALAAARALAPDALVVALTPAGEVLGQPRVEQLAHAQQDIIFLCGHYEGFDQRILDQADLKISIGDYVLTGGEMPALVMLDTLIRFIPGVLGKSESAMEESFSNNLLEYPQYTRPIEYQGKTVPDILLSGDHAKIKQWRLKEAIRTTYLLRPDLLAKANLSKGEGKLFLEVVAETKDKTNE